MPRFALALVCSVTLLSSIKLAGSDIDNKYMQKIVLKLVVEFENKGTIAKSAIESIRKNEDFLFPLKHIYKPKTRKGLGVESTLLQLGRRPITKRDLQAKAQDLIRIGSINVVIAETMKKPVDKNIPKRFIAQWNKEADDLKNAAVLLIAGAKKADADMVNQAVKQMNNTCVNCHALGRIPPPPPPPKKKKN